MSKQIQIEQSGVGVPGMGGLNHHGLASFGWEPGMWLTVEQESSSGVFVRLPESGFPVFIHHREITAERDTEV
jgi:hypothetical protein